MRSPSDLHPLSIQIGSELKDLPPGPIWIACSGGLDSSVLARLAVPALQAQERPAGLVYVDHRQHERTGPAADAVRALAEGLGACFEAVSLDEVGPGASEADLRTARFVAFLGLAERRDLRALLLGHHRDDQVETILFRLRRGPGSRGLAGIPPRPRLTNSCSLVRPFLEVPRRTLEAVAGELGLTWVEDPTNTDLRFARNRLRHVEIPRLRRRHQAFDQRLLAIAEKRRNRNDRLARECSNFIDGNVDRGTDRCWIRGPALLRESPALREMLLQIEAGRVTDRPLLSRLVRRLDRLAHSEPGTLLDDADGLLGEKRGEDLLLTTRSALGEPPDGEQALPAGATSTFGTTGWVVRNRTNAPLRVRSRDADGTAASPGLRRRLRSLAGRWDRDRVPLLIRTDGLLVEVSAQPAEIEIVERPALHFGDHPGAV